METAETIYKSIFLRMSDIVLIICRLWQAMNVMHACVAYMHNISHNVEKPENIQKKDKIKTPCRQTIFY